MSDLHIDFNYTIGSNADCEMAMCCRPDNGDQPDEEKRAKKWGAWKCNMPVWSIESMLEFIRDTVKPDVIVWTGDSIPHNFY